MDNNPLFGNGYWAFMIFDRAAGRAPFPPFQGLF